VDECDPDTGSAGAGVRVVDLGRAIAYHRYFEQDRMRRIDAEPLRDAMLSAGGLLDERLFGQSIPVARRPDGERVSRLQPVSAHFLALGRDQPRDPGCALGVATRAINPILHDAQGNAIRLGFVDGNFGQILNQMIGIAIAFVLAIVGTLAILKLVDVVIGLRVTSEDELQGLDVTQHGEEGYYWEASPV